MKKEYTTRFDEGRLRIENPQQMVGKILAEDVKRKWMEDFVDKETGEVKSIERSELVIRKGHKLNKEDVAQISFHMQEGSVKDVLVTNQERTASYDKFHCGYFEVVAQDKKKKKRLLLYAIGIPMAMQIAIDYCEQCLDETFSIRSIKQADDYKVVSMKPMSMQTEDKESEVKEEFYTVVATYFDDFEEGEKDMLFLTLAKDADTAIAIIRAYISADEKRREFFGDDYRVTVSKSSAITDVIPAEFSKTYIDNFKLNEKIMDGQRVGQQVSI